MSGIGSVNWDSALCAQVDPALWFPPPGGGVSKAKRTCSRCPCAEECRAWAVPQADLEGVWGGLSERERRLARKGEPLPECDACGRRFTRGSSRDYHKREACKGVAP